MRTQYWLVLLSQTPEVGATLFETLGSVQGVRVAWTRHRAHATLLSSLLVTQYRGVNFTLRRTFYLL